MLILLVKGRMGGGIAPFWSVAKCRVLCCCFGRDLCRLFALRKSLSVHSSACVRVCAFPDGQRFASPLREDEAEKTHACIALRAVASYMCLCLFGAFCFPLRVNLSCLLALTV